MFVGPSPAGRPRVGVVVPLHGHGATERNLLRRRLKEILRREWLAAAWAPSRGREPRALDVLVRAGAGAYDSSFEELRRLLLDALGLDT